MDDHSVSIGDGGSDMWLHKDKPLESNLWLDDASKTEAATSQQQIWQKLQTLTSKEKSKQKGDLVF